MALISADNKIDNEHTKTIWKTFISVKKYHTPFMLWDLYRKWVSFQEDIIVLQLFGLLIFVHLVGFFSFFNTNDKLKIRILNIIAK